MSKIKFYTIVLPLVRRTFSDKFFFLILALAVISTRTLRLFLKRGEMWVLGYGVVFTEDEIGWFGVNCF